MIDPRFANIGAVPLAAGYGAQQMPYHHHRHRHHNHRNHKHGRIGDSSLSRDESIHKVDHGHHHFQHNEGAPFGGGFGVPYGVAGFGAGAPAGFYHQQQPFAGGKYGFGGQYQGNAYDQGHFGGGLGAPIIKQHRHHHHRHHRHEGVDTVNAGGDQAQGIPEQLIGQRSSSVLGNEAPLVRSPILSAEGGSRGEPPNYNRHHRRRHHRRHHHHSGEPAGFGYVHQSRHAHAHAHTTAAADGYGHINEDLIFIERGDHSPHRQEPPVGYEYKGKIEVQGLDREIRARTHHTQASGLPLPPLPVQISQPVAPAPNIGPCPPGWQQMVLTAAPGGPCPPGASMYTAQVIGGAGVAQPGLSSVGGGFGGHTGGMSFGAVGSMGAAALGGGLASLAASLPFPPQGQLVADYIVESSAGGVSSSGGSGYLTDYQQTSGGGSFTEHHHGEQVEEHISGRPTIIEVWQKRPKPDVREKTRSSSRSPTRSPIRGPNFDFDRFRNDILAAIERVAHTGATPKIQWTAHDGGTQTQFHPTSYEDKRETDRRTTTSSGEVRVIVQPIQPVFYMPRQTETSSTTAIPPVGPAPVIQQTTSSAPNVVYVPRNVYVPVIKPVFVPRERVIVRPQVIHVARPVLVDRPVPVTQRPIIIDRERPIPVPVRSAGQGAAQTGGSKIIREEYVYRDNLPVAYGGRCAEFSGGVNYGYMPAQQEHQYATSSTHEVASGYQTQGPVINVTVPEQYQHSRSATQLNAQQGAGGSYHETYTNVARTSSTSAVDVAPLNCTGPIEILDSTVNPSWQRTDQSSLVRRYGRPAYDIVQKTDQVEQQMYQELRQRSSSGGIQRSDSAASYVSGPGVTVTSGGNFGAHSTSFTSMPLGDIQNLNSDVILNQGSAPIPVNINY